ncbi:hypothetical protein LAUMK13_02865 [Mycobacterium innocens]|uniref:Uncharacterized protein n=1 Tax=Mycobacterium innocens TaxID=2341083 RepID=A0A498Q3T7_9MYCO|nr:hypothetical protein LAUMK13_02865 [Mycobacterium innocens]
MKPGMVQYVESARLRISANRTNIRAQSPVDACGARVERYRVECIGDPVVSLLARGVKLSSGSSVCRPYDSWASVIVLSAAAPA